MRKCEDCKLILEDDVRFCPSCGKKIGDIPPLRPKGLPSWAYGVIAGFVLIVLMFTLILAPGRESKRLASAQKAAPKHIIAPAAREQNIAGSLAHTPKIADTPKNGQEPLAGKPTGSLAIRTPAEAAIKDVVAQSQGLRSVNAIVDDVIADPRQGVVIVTFSVPGGISLTKSSIMQATGVVAKAAFAANAQVKFVTVRCVVTAGDTSMTQIAFVGDMARATIDSLGENASREHLDSAFANKWWNPQLN